MARQSKNRNFSEVFHNINKEFSALLTKCKNGIAVDLLGREELKKLEDGLLTILKQNNTEEINEVSAENIKNCLELLLCILNNSNSNEIKLRFITAVKYINSDKFFTNEAGIISSISKVNEHWMAKIQMSEEIQGVEYLTIKHLLGLCTSDRPLVSDLQRLSAIRKSVTAVPFEKTVPSLKPLLIKFVQKPQVLSSEHGQRFISQAFVLSHKIMMEIHKTIMLELGSCNRKKASDYGKIYILAWHTASEDMRKDLEKTCFQHVMETMMKEQRTSLELNKNSQNILTVLETWHCERKKKNPDFITMITNAYQPILWKYLQSAFNVHRCNAADVLFKAFPLQRADDNALDAETLFNEQFNAMLACLTDDCHIIRIIGIREICNILSLYWNSFNPEQIQSFMSVLAKQNANDASFAEVRKMVYIGFQSLVKSTLSREYVKQLLPKLANNIHDINQKVRIAFIQLLICIKELKDPNFKYSDVVSMFNIQYRLAEDNIVVGQWIVKLLMRNYYHSKMSVVEWTKRFIYLIKTYRNSYRNFFFYSSKSLPFIDACNIICEILTQIGMFVVSKFKTDSDNDGNTSEKPKEKKKGNKKVPLVEWNGNQTSASSSSSEIENKDSKKCAFDDCDVVSGLFDIVTILWILHDVKLTKPENEEVRFKLYDIYIKYAQPFINYYKDSSIFLGVITLSGSIPPSLLRNNSITLPGYCIKMLKSIQIDSCNKENEEIISMLIALVKWGRGNEILEQIGLWLDAAFETKDMNETILPRRRVKISETIQPNSIVAIYLLDALLKKEYVKLNILKKNYCELFSLWKFMSRIRKLIETRIEQGEPFEEDLVSDTFLNLCFRRYVKLIPLLKEQEEIEEQKENQSQSPSSSATEVFVNRQKEIENVIEWGENFLFPLLQGEVLEEDDVKLITTALEDILNVSDNMIIVHMVNNFFHFKIAHFVLKLLSTRYRNCFIKAASRITVALNFSAKLLFKVKDDLQIFSTVIPSLMSHTLDALTNSSDLTKKLEEDMPSITNCFGKILATYHDNLSSTSNLKENARQLKLMVSFFVDGLAAIISREIPREDFTVPVYTSPSQLPPIAKALFSLFYSKKVWTPLSLHVISSKLSGKNCCIKTTVSYILLLHLYAASDKKVNQADLKKALPFATKSLSKFKESLESEKHAADIIFSENDTETNTKKTWPSNAATKGYSGSWTGVGGKTEKIFSEEEFIHPVEMDEDKSESTQSFQCDKNNLEMDFINYGFELIRNIETLTKEQVETENSL